MTGGIFAVLDDIAALLDDAAVMSKLAAKKTAGILGDDLAVNAEKATGFRASRELPVLWAITKGSFVNKLIIVPLALLLSAYAPWLVVPILLIGGVYLSFEGAEKIHHTFFPAARQAPPAATVSDSGELLAREKEKIRSAVRTDFILSIEIVMIALGVVMHEALAVRVAVVAAIALLATVGVYGVVALIVRMDDAGLFLLRLAEKFTGAAAAALKRCGTALIVMLPHIIRALGVIGTVAMLLVGGGMFTHNIEALHHLVEQVPSLLADFVIGLAVGGVALLAVKLVSRAAPKRAGQ